MLIAAGFIHLAYFLALIAVLAVVLTYLDYVVHKRIWNNGDCPRCRIGWKFVSSCYDGLRRYTCPRCGEIVEIGYRSVDRGKP
jgi:hypothetical protein